MAYDLTPLKAPRSAGGLLRTLVWLAEGPLGGLLAKKFFSDIGITALRATPISAAPASEHLLLRQARGAPDEPGERPSTPAARAHPEGFPFETVADFAAAYESKRLSPEDVAERVIEATRAQAGLSPEMRIVIAQNVDDVMAQAKASAERWARGAPLGPLDGVPVGVKDEVDQLGYPTTVGTRFLGVAPATTDSTVVARLRAAGAVLIGKLNMHEIGMGVTGLNPNLGAARNPYDPHRATGGSSSGSGAAVASGLCPIAVGADGGGSIRIPASLCGVVGLKATFGRISEHGAAPLCWSVAHVGPLAATARDAAIGYLAMAGRDAADPNTSAQPPLRLRRFEDEDLSGLRVGVYRQWFESADPGVVAACDRVLAELCRRGAKTMDITIPDLAMLRTAHLITIVSEMLAGQLPHLAKRAYALDTRLNLALASHMTSQDYVHAQRARARIDRHFATLLEEVDVFITPTTAATAPLLPKDALKSGESNLALSDQMMRFAPAANLTGLPAISCPCGYDEGGLPIGVQFMGRAWSEDLLLRLAHIVEGFTERRPAKIHTRLLDD